MDIRCKHCGLSATSVGFNSIYCQFCGYPNFKEASAPAKTEEALLAQIRDSLARQNEELSRLVEMVKEILHKLEFK